MEQDILQTPDRTILIIMQDEMVDVLTGEVVQAVDYRKIGNLGESPGFIKDIERYETAGQTIPHIPAIRIQRTTFPFFIQECTVCGNKNWNTRFDTICIKCGGFTICVTAE